MSFEPDYAPSKKLPSFEEAVRRVTRRYGMGFGIDDTEMCDLCATSPHSERGGSLPKPLTNNE